MPHIASRRAASAAVASGALAIGSFALAVPAHASARSAIAGTLPSWAVASARLRAQPVTPGTVTARVYLAGNTAGLTAFATAVSTPGTRQYRHFLSPAALQARFGTRPGQLAKIESWLRAAGLRIAGVSNHVAGGYVEVRGPAAAAARAFDVTFGRYKLAGQGVVRAPEQAATAPAGVARYVLTITGLSSAREQMRPMTARPGKLPPPGAGYKIGRPCSSYYGQKVAVSKPKAYGAHQPWVLCGYTPRQLRSAYGVTASGETGAGQTVAVVDAYASPTMLADANAYARAAGDRPFRPGQYRQYLPSAFRQAGPSKCDAAGWYGEESLDVEAVHGMAPAASVRFVAAATCQDPDLADALARIVNHHLASIVTNSYGDPTDAGTATREIYHLIFIAGTAEGIGFEFSSGDSGYDSPGEAPGYSDKTQVEYPTSDPFVTSVGGTSLAVGASRNYKFETSWGTIIDPLGKRGRKWRYAPPGPYPSGFEGGSGGGTSTVFTRPWYQKGAVPASLSRRLPTGKTSPVPMREVPDVAAVAAPDTGFAFGETLLEPNGKTYGFQISRIGGTSVSSPVFAGIEADAQQAAGGALGFANPLIYQAYAAGGGAFHDVTDPPPGASRLALARSDYSNPATGKGPLQYELRTLGIDGEGAAALHATAGYDDATGVGSPRHYIEVAGQIGR